jgi:hypothetical protein
MLPSHRVLVVQLTVLLPQQQLQQAVAGSEYGSTAPLTIQY